MTTRDLRRQAKRRIDALAEERLQVADDFLAYLEERASDEATEELLGIPGFLERFNEAQRQAAAGETVSLKSLQQKDKRATRTRSRRQP